jgi:quinol monooxygenase YgiN
VPIKVLIKRRFKKEHSNRINHVIKEVRFAAMDQEGYLSSETLRDHQDPLRVVVASNWRSIKNWKNSASRKSREKKFAKFLDGQTEYEIFDL